jgi:predicted XRE-type DNA-binding protein
VTKIVTGQLHRVRRGRGKGFAPAPPPAPVPRPARVAVMLALAHQIQRAIEGGKLANQAEAARRLGLTRARLSQLLDLTLLAPDIQERVLFLEAGAGTQPLGERVLRRVVRLSSWVEQRAALPSSRFTTVPESFPAKVDTRILPAESDQRSALCG